jgi:hypothetical protein
MRSDVKSEAGREPEACGIAGPVHELAFNLIFLSVKKVLQLDSRNGIIA